MDEIFIGLFLLSFLTEKQLLQAIKNKQFSTSNASSFFPLAGSGSQPATFSTNSYTQKEQQTSNLSYHRLAGKGWGKKKQESMAENITEAAGFVNSV